MLTVKAKAGIAGNHVFRAEVHCKSAGTRLVREEMTRFYQDNPVAQPVPAADGKRATMTDPVITGGLPSGKLPCRFCKRRS